MSVDTRPPRVAVLTQWTTDVADYDQVASLTVPNREEYCACHGYTHVVQCGHYRDPKLYYAVDRLHRLRDLMYTGPEPFDLVWVLNVQSLVTNLSIPVTSLVDPDHDFWITRDCNAVNAGSFLIRRCDWAREWLDLLIREAPLVNHCWHENQVIIQRCTESPWRERIKVFDDQRVFNSYLYGALYRMTHAGEWQPGDFVLSLPGTNLDTRVRVLKETLPKVVR